MSGALLIQSALQLRKLRDYACFNICSGVIRRSTPKCPTPFIKPIEIIKEVEVIREVEVVKEVPIISRTISYPVTVFARASSSNLEIGPLHFIFFILLLLIFAITFWTFSHRFQRREGLRDQQIADAKDANSTDAPIANKNETSQQLTPINVLKPSKKDVGALKAMIKKYGLKMRNIETTYKALLQNSRGRIRRLANRLNTDKQEFDIIRKSQLVDIVKQNVLYQHERLELQCQNDELQGRLDSRIITDQDTVKALQKAIQEIADLKKKSSRVPDHQIPAIKVNEHVKAGNPELNQNSVKSEAELKDALIETLHEQLRICQVHVDDLQKNNIKLQDELKKQTDYADAADDAAKELEKQNDELETQVTALQKENRELQTEKTELERAKKYYFQRAQRLVQDEDARKAETERQRKSLEAEFEAKTLTLDPMLENFSAENSALKARNRTLHTANHNFWKANETLNKNCNSLVDQNRAKCREVESLRKHKDTLVKEKDKLYREIESTKKLRVNLQTFTRLTSEVKSLHAELSTSHSIISNQQAQINTLQAENASLSGKLQSAFTLPHGFKLGDRKIGAVILDYRDKPEAKKFGKVEDKTKQVTDNSSEQAEHANKASTANAGHKIQPLKIQDTGPANAKRAEKEAKAFVNSVKRDKSRRISVSAGTPDAELVQHLTLTEAGFASRAEYFHAQQKVNAVDKATEDALEEFSNWKNDKFSINQFFARLPKSSQEQFTLTLLKKMNGKTSNGPNLSHLDLDPFPPSQSPNRAKESFNARTSTWGHTQFLKRLHLKAFHKRHDNAIARQACKHTLRVLRRPLTPDDADLCPNRTLKEDLKQAVRSTMGNIAVEDARDLATACTDICVQFPPRSVTEEATIEEINTETTTTEGHRAPVPKIPAAEAKENTTPVPMAKNEETKPKEHEGEENKKLSKNAKKKLARQKAEADEAAKQKEEK